MPAMDTVNMHIVSCLMKLDLHVLLLLLASICKRETHRTILDRPPPKRMFTVSMGEHGNKCKASGKNISQPILPTLLPKSIFRKVCDRIPSQFRIRVKFESDPKLNKTIFCCLRPILRSSFDFLGRSEVAVNNRPRSSSGKKIRFNEAR